MDKMHYYQTIETGAQAEYKDRGSRFIAYTYPLKNTDEFKKIIAAVKKEHPKANHHCFAYRLGTDGTQFRASDAGEPSGTAGRPILGQIDSRNVTDILIVVVRYFGGTLLGVPGLINAYKTAAALALQVTPVVRKPILDKFNLQFDYTQLNPVMTIVKQFDCSVLKQDVQLFCSLDIGIPKNRVTEAMHRLGDIANIAIKPLEEIK
ncbi:IMPACT family protein [Niabella soli]|uniref:Thymidylate synthase n=1 Tax=Niabella soli DSM 19437 TaxID=929713 RepID=W0EV08_9BACT|nr:YigZ family protein [Niabella soli]AHF14635.1 thymidylate synthase [Niabella soli DSM 19437]